MSIAKNIKWLRESHNLTQAEFGKIAGVSDKAVSTWENGIAEPRMGAIQRISEHFHISKGDIVDDSSDPKPSFLLSDSEIGLIDAFRCLSQSGQSKLLAYAEDLIASGRYRL